MWWKSITKQHLWISTTKSLFTWCTIDQKKKIPILGSGRQRKLTQDVGEKVSHNIKIMLQKKMQLGSLNAFVSLHCKWCCRQYLLLLLLLSAILVVSKPSIWCSLANYQIRTSTQKTLPWWVGQGWDPLQNPTWVGTLLLLSSSHTSINLNY